VARSGRWVTAQTLESRISGALANPEKMF